jgi:hypothetical protein
MKNKQFYWAIAAIVIIVAIIWAYKAKHAIKQTPIMDNVAQQTTNQSTPAPATAAQTENTWTGVLKKSDSPTKGNVMLVTKDRTIYMKTSRDFSSLLDKNVSVTYEGTWQNFVLGDVTLAEQQ